MAIIYSYPPVASLQTTDLFIISRVPTDPDEISNFSVTTDALASFVTSRVNLNFQGGVGTGVVNLDTQSLNIIGTTNEIETTANAQTLQIGLPDNVTITNNLNVGGQTLTDTLEVTTSAEIIGQLLMGGVINMSGNLINNVNDPVNPQDAATKSYVDTAVTGLLEFKGTFRADTGEILSGSNAGAYLYNCPGGAGTRVAVAVGDYYIVATAGGNFYCSGDLLNVGDSVYGVADAATDSSTINDWGTVEGDNIEGSGTANTIPFWTDSQILADSMLSQNVAANLLSVDGGLTATSFSTFQSGLQSDGPAYFYGITQLGDAAVDLIQVTGTLQLEGPIRDVNTDLGSTDQILVSDAGGNVTWTDLTAISTGTAQKTSILVKNIAAVDGGVTLTKGTPVYIYGSVGASERLYIDAADASNAAKMPCVGLLDQDLLPNGEGTATVTGKLKNLITSPIDGATPTENDTLYVKPGGGLTLTKPTGVANLIQNVGQVGRVSTASDGNIVVSAILRTNDVPNLTEGRLWAGSTGNTIESQVIFVNEAQNRFGVNTATPVTTLHVQGGVRITGGVDLFQQHDNAFAGTNAGNQGTIIGASNAAFGKNAMAVATLANNNSVLGYNAFATSPTGNRNVAIGSGAIGLTTGIGEGNVAIGYQTLQNGTGSNNIVIGQGAISNGTGGSSNVSIGRNTLVNNTSSNNVAVGERALQNNTNGAFNTAVGAQSLNAVTGGTGRQNTSIGFQAGNNITTGQNNIVIGYQSSASIATTSNEITLGNSSISVLRCSVTTITSLSDERDKTNITDLEYGLDFINSLSPKQFTWNQRPEYMTEVDEEGNETQVEIENANKGKKDFGFIAQEVQTVDNDILRLVYSENPEKLEMSYGKLVPILVKAIKDLTARVEALEA